MPGKLGPAYFASSGCILCNLSEAGCCYEVAECFLVHMVIRLFLFMLPHDTLVLTNILV